MDQVVAQALAVARRIGRRTPARSDDESVPSIA
jgi:hypothetical protein